MKKMKKIIIAVLSAFIILTLSACTGEAPNTDQPTSDNTSDVTSSGAVVTSQQTGETEESASNSGSETSSGEKSNILVAYFSATNTTKPLAEYVADGLGADLYEIVPVTPYTSADLNYSDNNSRSTIEMNDPNCRPEISGTVADMSQYDIVFIAYPIWWGEAPRIVSTFVESYDFSGKTIIPFCTSGGSGIGSSGGNLANLTSGATWLSGRRFGGGTSRSTIISWVNSLGLNITAQ